MLGDYEGGAPNVDELRGGLGCFRFLLRDLDEAKVLGELADRYGSIGETANRRIELGRILREASPLLRARLVADTAALAVAAQRAPKELGKTNLWNRDALDDALTNLAQTCAQDRADFVDLVELETSELDGADAGRLRRIIKDISNGLGHAGIE